MLLSDPNYSCLDSYIEATDQFFSENKVKCDYKSYDKEKDNFIFFICYDLKSNIKINSDLFLRDVTYEGSLKFTYNKTIDEVYVSSVPYVTYGNAIVPVFTSDIAEIIVDKLKGYVPAWEIKLVFANPLTLLAEDKGAISVIPSLRDTKNHLLLIATLANIEKEKRKVKGDIIRYKAKQDRKERSTERAIAKKRKMFGLDPKDFISPEEFQNEVVKKAVTIWQTKIQNIERHLKANEKKYKNIILEEDYHYEGITYLLLDYLLYYLQESGIKEINLSQAYRERKNADYLPEWLKADSQYFDKKIYTLDEIKAKIAGNYYNSRKIEFIIDYLLEIYDYQLDAKAKELAKVWKYFNNIINSKIDKTMLAKALDFMQQSNTFLRENRSPRPDINYPLEQLNKEYEIVNSAKQTNRSYYSETLESLKIDFEMGKYTTYEIRYIIVTLLKSYFSFLGSQDIPEVWNYFNNLNPDEVDQDMLAKALNYILEADLTMEDGVFKTFNRMLPDLDIKSLTRIAAREESYIDVNCYIYGTFLLDDYWTTSEGQYYKNAKYHPAYKDAYYRFANLAEEEKNFWIFLGDMYGEKVPALDLVIQMKKLKEKLEYYNNLVVNPQATREAIFLNFNNVTWGSLIQLPYWLRMYRDPHVPHYIYGLLMIHPGITNIDFNKIVPFIDGPKKKFWFNELKLKYDFFVVTIPSSMPKKEIEKIIDYVHTDSFRLNFVCEDIETAILVKGILINKAALAFTKGEDYFRTQKGWLGGGRYFINVNPNYYDSFLVNTPTNQSLWNQYDYYSDLGIDKQFKIAINYCVMDKKTINYPLLNEILLGGYSKPMFPDILDEYTHKLDNEKAILLETSCDEDEEYEPEVLIRTRTLKDEDDEDDEDAIPF